MKLKVVFFLLFLCSFLSAQRKITRQEYIKTYKDIAIQEMKRTGIPASITMAQAILESGNGNSRLAKKANNHFGIKCHDWKGKTIKHNDDKKNECFRKYNNAYESFVDHSDFLITKKRYAFLFDYHSTNYKDWAKGLKKAGYATSRTYDKALIKLIEENKLFLFDEEINIEDKLIVQSSKSINKRKIEEINRVKYIIAREGDTYPTISVEMDLLPWELAKYNETSNDRILKPGDKVYLQPKRRKARAGIKTHKVKEGETLYSISQKYAVRVDRICMYNNLKIEDNINPGQTIWLRKNRKKGRNKITSTKDLEEIIPLKPDNKENSEEEEISFDFDLEE